MIERLPPLPDNPVNAARVLVVEDDPIVRDFCMRLLRLKGYAISAYPNNPEARKAIRAQAKCRKAR
ncbi:MAG: hypothetical protein OHK0050_29560 [Roseiflexaceae bacterium]